MHVSPARLNALEGTAATGVARFGGKQPTPAKSGPPVACAVHGDLLLLGAVFQEGR
jgi:hypothetical protein